MCFFWISSQLNVHWSLLIHSTHFLGILQPLVSTESSEIKKKGQIEKHFNDFLPNRDYFQQNLERYEFGTKISNEWLKFLKFHPCTI